MEKTPVLSSVVLALSMMSDAQAVDTSWIQDLSKNVQTAVDSQKLSARQIVEAAKRVQACPAAQKIIDEAPYPHSIQQQAEGQKYPDLLIFVSFSMPFESLKALNLQTQKHGGKLVFRGLVGGSFKEMTQKLKGFEVEVLIDPTLFRKHQVESVPTFIQNEDRMSGNVSLNHVLKTFKGGKL